CPDGYHTQRIPYSPGPLWLCHQVRRFWGYRVRLLRDDWLDFLLYHGFHDLLSLHRPGLTGEGRYVSPSSVHHLGIEGYPLQPQPASAWVRIFHRRIRPYAVGKVVWQGGEA